MQLSVGIISAVFLAATAAAAKPHARHIHTRRDVNPNAQSCTCTQDRGLFTGTQCDYTVQIGEPFDDSFCTVIKSNLQAGVTSDVNNFGCFFAQDGAAFNLAFTVDIQHGREINDVLDTTFPNVNGFNCPDF